MITDNFEDVKKFMEENEEAHEKYRKIAGESFFSTRHEAETFLIELKEDEEFGKLDQLADLLSEYKWCFDN